MSHNLGVTIETPGAESKPSSMRSMTPWPERIIELGLVLCGSLAIVATIGILAVLAWEAVLFFSEVSFFEFFGDLKWAPLFADKHFGVWPLIAGTLMSSVIPIAVALPFGLMAAIYLSEFAHPQTRKVVKPALELLAGVPTIVYGFFALTVVTPALQQVIPGLAGFNALSPGIVMGVMIIPMISSLSEDAIYSVPVSLREAAYGLGAGRMQTIFRVVIPSAWSGIAAALTLAISRAIGETMIVTVAAGQQPNLNLDPREPIQTMTAYIVNIAGGDVPTGTIEYRTIFAVGIMLFLMTLTMNLISYRLSMRIRKGAGR
ncbi:MAG: phosphate ABC transporter permease subunit PstC [Haliangiales bacterium]